MHFISGFDKKKITQKHQTTSIRSCSHCTSVLSNSAVARFTTFPYFCIGLPMTLALARIELMLTPGCACIEGRLSSLRVHRNETDHPPDHVHTVHRSAR